MNKLLIVHGLPLSIYVLLLVVAESSVSVDVRCVDRERAALLELKRGFVDSSRLSTWGEGEHQKECCNWKGVECSDNTNHVVFLDLHTSKDGDYLQLQPLGDIAVAASLSKLIFLTYLDLSRNDFDGTEIPKSIGSLLHLRYLNLSFSGFGGTIPQQLGNLSSLEDLDVAEYSGNLKSNLEWLPHLTSLQILSLGGVDLRTADTWTKLETNNLTHLKKLVLSDCNIAGTIPEKLGELSQLQYLDLSFNSLTGVVPHQLGNLSSLEYLDLAGTSGSLWFPDHSSRQIPDFIGSFTNLRYLDLSSWNFVGNIPKQLGALSQLRYLDLSGNSLTGIIPHEIGNLSQMQIIYLGQNKLHGYIPNQLGRLSCLQELSLEYNNLGGIIPETFGNLSSLQEITLDGNHFEGTLPNSFWDFCHLRSLKLRSNNFNERLEDFLNFTMGRKHGCSHQSLQNLDLSYNQFTGLVPDLSLFLELQMLDLSGNKLNGTVSDGIGQISNLVKLDIGSNPLQGRITEDHFSKLSKLTDLDMSNTSLSFSISKSWIPPFQLDKLKLSYCKVGPYFPKWLKNQKSIKEMYMDHSQIVDVLPDWFWRVNENLVHLDLSYNKIQGEIANLSMKSDNFQSIDLSANQFRGEVPPFLFQAGALNLSTNMLSGSMFPLCSMTHNSSMALLDISHNQLSQELPVDCWLHLEQLMYLDLSFNDFSGGVPTSLLSLPNLHALHLRNNRFRRIPSLSSSNLTSFRSLDLSENEISGLLPLWIGDKLVNLNILSLRNNKFYGSLPSNICNLKKILVFDLSANYLSGSIPKCLNEFNSLSNSSNLDIDLFYTDITKFDPNFYFDSIVINWKGGLNEYKSILRLQRVIDLSNNQLTGEIPDEVMDLIQLLSLNLSYNKLGGSINQKIGQLVNLESLDLSKNLLHGPIPPSIAQLNFLAQLNLSFNNLSGKIPTGFQLQTLKDTSIYYGNLELCGPPLDISCPDDRKDNGKSNIIDEGEDEDKNLFEMYEFYIFMSIGYIVGFWTSCGSLIFNKSWRDIFFNLCTRICDNVYVKVRILVNKLRRSLEA